jgi:DNA-binding CsgD family transcriptional regulator
MPGFLIGVYTVFFATGFMGAAALFLLELRLQSRLLRLLLLFQMLMMLGMGLIVLYFFLESAGSVAAASWLLVIITLVNVAVWVVVPFVVRNLKSASRRRRFRMLAAQVLPVIVAAKNLANAVMMIDPVGVAGTLSGTREVVWTLGGHVLAAFAMAAFGFALVLPPPPNEPRVLRPLLKAYGICAIVFSPIGTIEYAVEAANLAWLPEISLDHFFYLAWNVVSMSAAIRVFRPTEAGTPVLESVSAERIRALRLSPREVEMAVLIARGMANKEIAGELRIAPGTVRTHIYNLYRKAGARSRVELLNKLRD